mmetsp:Transcript_30074/g.94322  ORF Transcript_30074/g.94322 Transcript_30074/m.94322 type:complete len:231 (+) Transcript_30074:159-851(+)
MRTSAGAALPAPALVPPPRWPRSSLKLCLSTNSQRSSSAAAGPTYDVLRGGTSLVLVHYVFEPRVHQEEEDEVRHPVVLLARRRRLPRRRLLGRRLLVRRALGPRPGDRRARGRSRNTGRRGADRRVGSLLPPQLGEAVCSGGQRRGNTRRPRDPLLGNLALGRVGELPELVHLHVHLLHKHLVVDADVAKHDLRDHPRAVQKGREEPVQQLELLVHGRVREHHGEVVVF